MVPGRSCPDLYRNLKIMLEDTQPLIVREDLVDTSSLVTNSISTTIKLKEKPNDLHLDLNDINFQTPSPGQKCFGKKSDVERVLDSRCPCLQSKCLHLSGSLLGIFLVGFILVFFLRHYLKDFLQWLEHVDGWISGLLFICMFTVVSFPMTWGYIVLNVAAGYLYGFLIGIVTTTVSVTIGVAVSLIICRKFIRGFVQSKLQSEHLKAIIRVVESRRGFKVVLLTRLTPIPFGLQNGLFAITNMNISKCLLSSFLGLLPTQALNAYMGSTLRTMEDVVHHNSAGGYFMLAIQVGIGVFLMWYVVRRARYELNKACLPPTTDLSELNKHGHVMTPQLMPLQRTTSSNFFTSEQYQRLPNDELDEVILDTTSTNSTNPNKKQGHKRAHSASAILYALQHKNEDL